jgi:hypothetical protein
VCLEKPPLEPRWLICKECVHRVHYIVWAELPEGCPACGSHARLLWRTSRKVPRLIESYVDPLDEPRAPWTRRLFKVLVYAFAIVGVLVVLDWVDSKGWANSALEWIIIAGVIIAGVAFLFMLVAGAVVGLTVTRARKKAIAQLRERGWEIVSTDGAGEVRRPGDADCCMLAAAYRAEQLPRKGW